MKQEEQNKMNLSETMKLSGLSNDKPNASFLAFDDYLRIQNALILASENYAGITIEWKVKAEKELQIQEEQNKNASDVEKLELLIDRLINLEYPEVSPRYLFIIHDVKCQIDSIIQSIKDIVKN